MKPSFTPLYYHQNLSNIPLLEDHIYKMDYITKKPATHENTPRII